MLPFFLTSRVTYCNLAKGTAFQKWPKNIAFKVIVGYIWIPISTHYTFAESIKLCFVLFTDMVGASSGPVLLSHPYSKLKIQQSRMKRSLMVVELCIHFSFLVKWLGYRLIKKMICVNLCTVALSILMFK